MTEVEIKLRESKEKRSYARWDTVEASVFKNELIVVGGGVVGGEGQPVINLKDEGEKEVRAGVNNDKITLCETNMMY